MSRRAETPRRVTRSRSRETTPLPNVQTRQSHAYGAQGKAQLSAQVASHSTDFTSAFQTEQSASVDEQEFQRPPRTTGLSSAVEARKAIATGSRTRHAKSPLPLTILEEDEADIDHPDWRPPLSTTRPREAKTSPGKRASAAETSLENNTGRSMTDLGSQLAYEPNLDQPARSEQQLFPVREEARLGPPRSVAHPPVEVQLDEPQRNIYVQVNGANQALPEPPHRQPTWRETFWVTLQRYLPFVARLANLEMNPFVKFLLLLISCVGVTVVYLGMMLYITMSVTYATADLVPFPPPYNESARFFVEGTRVLWQRVPYDRPMSNLELMWLAFINHNFTFDELDLDAVHGRFQAAVNINHFEKIKKLEERMDRIEDNFKLHDVTLTALQNLLPSLIVVQRDDGRWEFPENFWAALQQRLSVSDGDTAPLWQAFMQSNQETLNRESSAAASEVIKQAVEKKYIISQANFIQALEENHEYLARRYRDEVHQIAGEIRDKAVEAAENTSRELFARHPANAFVKEQLETLVKAMDIHAAYEALRTVNYFSPGLGARIHPHLTSPTLPNRRMTWLAWAYTQVSPIYTPPPPPIMALVKWTEAKECWCTPYSKGGKAQIGVLLGHVIFPGKLVIEHIPADGTLDIKAAPRDFEVWAELNNEQEASALSDVIAEKTGVLLKDDTMPNWALIGRGRYDIHQNNYVQAFKMYEEASLVATKKIIVRINSNWGSGVGNDHVCLYRLRMTGTRVFPNNTAGVLDG